MRDQRIEFKEIDSEHLGSDKEYQKPDPNKNSSKDTKDKSSPNSKS